MLKKKPETAAQGEQIQQVPVAELHPFKDHPFKVLDDEAMLKTVESMARFGVLNPLIVRPRAEGGYEIISGHRRQHAAQLVGLKTLPIIVRELDDDQAILQMVESNLQRETIRPSERAFAYKMKMEVLKHQGARTDLTLSQVGTKLRSDEKVAQEAGESRNQVQRYIRLTHLIPELLELVDQKKISFNPAVELSYLTADEQRDFLQAMEDSKHPLSLSQAQRIKRLSRAGECSYDAILDVMTSDKKAELDRLTLKNETIRKYFPKSYTPRQMEEIILNLLEQWHRKRQRSRER